MRSGLLAVLLALSTGPFVACGGDASSPSADSTAGASGQAGAANGGQGGQAAGQGGQAAGQGGQAAGQGGQVGSVGGATNQAGVGGVKNPSSCKLAHVQDQPCKEEGLVCEFPGACKVAHVCAGGGWQVTFDGECCPPAAPAVGMPCPAVGLSCSFDAATVVCAADGWSTSGG